jgi:hypothetical protein
MNRRMRDLLVLSAPHAAGGAAASLPFPLGEAPGRFEAQPTLQSLRVHAQPAGSRTREVP